MTALHEDAPITRRQARASQISADAPADGGADEHAGAPRRRRVTTLEPVAGGAIPEVSNQASADAAEPFPVRETAIPQAPVTAESAAPSSGESASTQPPTTTIGLTRRQLRELERTGAITQVTGAPVAPPIEEAATASESAPSDDVPPVVDAAPIDAAQSEPEAPVSEEAPQAPQAPLSKRARKREAARKAAAEAEAKAAEAKAAEERAAAEQAEAEQAAAEQMEAERIAAERAEAEAAAAEQAEAEAKAAEAKAAEDKAAEDKAAEDEAAEAKAAEDKAASEAAVERVAREAETTSSLALAEPAKRVEAASGSSAVAAPETILDIADRDDISEDPASTLSKGFGRDSMLVAALEAEAEKATAEQDVPFDDLLGTGAAQTGQVTTSSLIIPVVPAQAEPGTPSNTTGEALVTGSVDLPPGLGSTGQDPNHFDGAEVDRLVEGDEAPASVTAASPISASKAVSSHGSTRDVVPATTNKSNRLLMTLAIAAAVLAVGVLAVLVIGYFGGAF